MFSRATNESSTTRPIATLRPASDMMLSVMPSGNSALVAATTVSTTGIPSTSSPSGSKAMSAAGGSQRSATNAMKTDSGMLTAITSVLRHESLYFPLTGPLRNSKITITAKIAPSTPSRATPLIDSWINEACSNTVSNWIEEFAASNSASTSNAASLELTVLASEVWLISNDRLGLPLTRFIVSVGMKATRVPAAIPSSSWRNAGSRLAMKS